MKYTFDYSRYGAGDVPDGDRELVDAARRAVATAWAPITGFRVGAAARLRSGEIISAGNDESPIGVLGVCAERNLLYYHQSHHAGDPIEAMAIVSEPDRGECYPCGVCRQAMAEAELRQKSPIRVIMAGGGSATVVERSSDLLPFLFKL